MNDFLRTITLSEVDIEDLVWAIETKLDEFSDDQEDEYLRSGYRNLESLKERLLAALSSKS